MKSKAGKAIVYGGFFGKTLITRESFLAIWQEQTGQIYRLADTEAEYARLREIREELMQMVTAKAEGYVTEAEAEQEGIPKRQP